MPDVYRELDNLHNDIREVRRDYVPERLFVELVSRVSRLEERLTKFMTEQNERINGLISAQNADSRSWLRGIGLAVLGAVLGAAAQIIRSGH